MGLRIRTGYATAADDERYQSPDSVVAGRYRRSPSIPRLEQRPTRISTSCPPQEVSPPNCWGARDSSFPMHGRPTAVSSSSKRARRGLADLRDVTCGCFRSAKLPRPLLVTRFYERGAVFSPDGRWLAFVTDESGRAEVYIQPFPGPGAKVPMSNNGGLQPMWSRDGRELFYREGDWMMAVSVTLDPFRVEAPAKAIRVSRHDVQPRPEFCGL